jgi:hypothetical protein
MTPPEEYSVKISSGTITKYNRPDRFTFQNRFNRCNKTKFL